MDIKIITGEYGSGKTEFILNLAIKRSKEGKVTLCDLDVINYYFRSRDAFEILKKHNIDVDGSNFEDGVNGHDLPAVSYAVKGTINSKSSDFVFFDLAGSHKGTKLLASFQDVFNDKTELVMVVNVFRERTDNVDGILKVMEEIENQCQMKVTGLVNNSNLLNFTTPQNILDGQKIIREVANKKGIKIINTFMNEKFEKELTDKVDGEIITFSDLVIRDKWM